MKEALIIGILFLLSLASVDAAGDRIRGVLLLAVSEEPARVVPKELRSVASDLERVFGYNSFYVLGQKKRNLVTGGEEWLIPSREFFFQVRCLEKTDTAYRLRIQLFHEKKLLLSTETLLARDAPLFIRGPEWGRGNLIFLLEVL